MVAGGDRGLSNQVIRSSPRISLETGKTLLVNMKEILSSVDRTQLLMMALVCGFIYPLG